MPLTEFICPDKQSYPVQHCLTKCRMSERCLTLPTLSLIAHGREWKGIASTTQLLNGTLQEFLKLTRPYTVDPDTRMFMIGGTKMHQELDVKAKELGLVSELPLSIDRDIFDLLELEDGQIILTDYKRWGSFKVAKALGIKKVGKRPNPDGECYKSSGAWGKAGSPKMISNFSTVPEEANNWEAELQLNRYRVKLAKLGIMVDKMRLQVEVRDGGTYIAEGRGVYRNSYIISIKAMPDLVVEQYFEYKNSCLMEALDKGSWSEPCNPKECWDNNRCKEYCDVWSYCPKGIQVHSTD